MSSYQGRPPPNVSQLINDLNTTSYDSNDFLVDESFSNDLDMFINTEFTNYDIPPLPQSSFNAVESLDAFDPASVDVQPSQSTPAYSNYNVPIQPAPPANGFALESNYSSPIQSPPSTHGAPSKRKSESTGPQNASPEDKSRMAAEEDKRRRNTAASARFRVKKKQREQTLEKTVKEVSDKNSQLEARLSQLEMENKWLKNLIIEKNGKQSREEIAAAFQKFRKESEERDVKGEEQHESAAAQ